MDHQFEAASAYESDLVPALMQAWAPRVADAAGISAGDRVLDVACGTGVLTRAAAAKAAPGGVVTGLDLDPGMLAVAARINPELRWQRGSASALPFADGTFDAVVSQFGLMFFPEPVVALREMMRVLVPGGRFAVAVWASLADTPAYAAETALVERHAPRAGEVLRMPFALGDSGRLRALFTAAGVPHVEIALEQGQGRFPNIRKMVEVDVRDWLSLVGVVLEPAVIDRILGEADEALAPYVAADSGGVTFASPALVASGVKPAAQ
jgi:SAM-dependent methyltransferase